MLKRMGLLEPLRAVKRRFYHRPNEFKPADPRLLISTIACLNWLNEHGALEGSDVIEFGIFRGFNVWFTHAYSRVLGVNDVRFFGFDSFFGIPPTTGIDADGTFKEGEFSAYREEVESFLTRYGVDWSKTFMVEGFFDQTCNADTANKYNMRRCSLCIVDADLYSSAKTALAFVEPYLAEHSILYFDDWNDYLDDPNKGEPRAFAEFQEEHAKTFSAEPFTDLKKIGGKGTAFIIHRLS